MNIFAISLFSTPNSIYKPNSRLLFLTINTVICFTNALITSTTRTLTVIRISGSIDFSFMIAAISSENIIILNDNSNATVMTIVII